MTKKSDLLASDTAIRLTPEEAACGGMSRQYALDGYSPTRLLSASHRRLASHTVELWTHGGTGEQVVVKSVASGLEGTLVNELIGQRFFNLLGLPIPRTSLVVVDGTYRLVLEYLQGYHTPEDPFVLPHGQENNPVIQSGILVDILLHHYDRQPYNFMFKDTAAVFIDFGGCLTTSPSGKTTGFNPVVDADEVYRTLKAFQGPYAVNEAYNRVLRIDPRQETFRIVNSRLVKRLVMQLAHVTDAYIDAIIETNVQDFQRAHPVRVQRIIDMMVKNLNIPVKELHYAHYHYNFQEAKETYTTIRDQYGSNESAYLKFALKTRRDSLISFFS